MTYFFLTLFMLFMLWRPQEWLFPWLTGWNILDAIFVGLVGCFVLELNMKRVKITPVPQYALILHFLIAAFMSFVATTYFAGILRFMPEVLKRCVFLVVLFAVFDRPSRLRGAARLLVFMAIVMSIHAVMQGRLGYGYMGALPQFVPGNVDRIAHTRSLFFGLFGDPNELAQILVAAIPFAFVMFKRRTFVTILLGFGLAWLFTMGVLSTHSRGGLVGLVLVFAVITVLALPARWLPFLMGSMMVGALFLTTFAAPFMDASARERIVFWGNANRVFKDNMMFGIGFEMFSTSSGLMSAHNAYVNCYTELGFFGYWGWFNFFHLGFLGAWRTRIALRKPETSDQMWVKRFAGAAIASLAGFCGSAYFLSRSYGYPLLFLFALLGVLPIVARNLLPEDSKFVMYDYRKDLLKRGTMLAFGGIIYIYFSVLLLNKVWAGR